MKKPAHPPDLPIAWPRSPPPAARVSGHALLPGAQAQTVAFVLALFPAPSLPSGTPVPSKCTTSDAGLATSISCLGCRCSIVVGLLASTSAPTIHPAHTAGRTVLPKRPQVRSCDTSTQIPGQAGVFTFFMPRTPLRMMFLNA